MHPRTAGARAITLAFALSYLVFLGPLVVSELVAPRPGAGRAALALGIAAFVALDVAYWARQAWGTRGLAAADPLLTAAMCAVAAALTFVDHNWLWGFVYCAVAAGSLSVRPTVAAGLIAATAALTFGVAALTRAVDENLLFLLLIEVFAGAGILGWRRIFESNAQLRQAREEVARLAVAEERLRFARDLHDLLGHSLSVIVLKAELAGRLAEASPGRAAQEVRDIEHVAREALREVREAVSGYRQASLSHELDSARTALGAAGVAARIDAGTGSLPALLDATLAWAVREGVTNVVRHSGASSCELRLARRDDAVELRLLDDGVGCDGCAAGSGLRGLQERVEARGGAVSYGPRPEGGFGLTVSLPLRERPRRAAGAVG